MSQAALSTNARPMELAGLLQQPRPRYSICTLVTRHAEYAAMVASFQDRGFAEPDCEFIFGDNSAGNRFDGFSGYNAFLFAARGDHIVICHQDIRLFGDGRAELDARLEELNSVDPSWAVCGNAGRAVDGSAVVRISDPAGDNRKIGAFPRRVLGLDENFVVIRRSANLGLAPRLRGFHHYAKVLCGVADDLGLSSYVIDFHVRHIGGTSWDNSYFTIRRDVEKLRRRQHRPRMLATNDRLSAVFTSRSRLLDAVANRAARSRFMRLVCRLARLDR